jgi:hypothetical protein
MFGHIQQADTSIESKRLPEAMFTTNTHSRSQDGKIGAPQQEQTSLSLEIAPVPPVRPVPLGEEAE